MPSPTTTRRKFTSAGLLLLALPATAHGPSRLKVSEKVSIAAPAAAVWARIGNFDALKDWHPAVATSVADNGNHEGSVRVVRWKAGGELRETLEEHNPALMKYAVRARPGGALAVTNYAATLVVSADGQQSVVEWRGAFYRGDPNNDPPPELNDDAAISAVSKLYRSGLDALKAQLERA